MLIGVVSSAGDSGFVRLIMGDSYVNMTLENIDKGDPLAVYKQMNGVDMFLGITFNNIRVSFFAFMFGLLAFIWHCMDIDFKWNNAWSFSILFSHSRSYYLNQFS